MKFILAILVCIITSCCYNNGVTIVMSKKIDTLSYRYYDYKLGDGGDSILFNYSRSFVLYTNNNLRYNIPVILDSLHVDFAVFDTGATFCLFPDTIKHIDSSSYTYIKDYSDGEKYKIQQIQFDKLIIGNTICNIGGEFFYGYHYMYTIIGGNFIKNFVWKIDNVHNEICFSQDTSSFSHQDCIKIPFDIVGNRPYIKCTINNKIYDMCLDTGGGGIFANIMEYDTTKIFSNTERYRRTNKNNEDSIILTKRYWSINDLKIDTLLFKDEIISHYFYENILGIDFFQRFEFVIFDYINQILYLGPTSKNKSIFYEELLAKNINTTGLWCKETIPSTIADISDSLQNTGINIGDTIIAINGNFNYGRNDIVKINYVYDSASVMIRKNNENINCKIRRKIHVAFPDTLVSYGRIMSISVRQREVAINHNYNQNGCVIKYYGEK